MHKLLFSDGLQCRAMASNMFFLLGTLRKVVSLFSFVTSSFLFLVEMPFAPSSVLAPSSDARSP